MAILHYHLPRHQGTGPLRKSFRSQLFHPLHGITLQHRATRATRAASVHQAVTVWVKATSTSKFMGKNGDFHQWGMENPIKMDDLGRLGSPIDGWFKGKSIYKWMI